MSAVLKRVAVASCPRLVHCQCSGPLGLDAGCKVRARRALDALLPLSDEMKGAWQFATDEGGNTTAETDMRAMLSAVKGEK